MQHHGTEGGLDAQGTKPLESTAPVNCTSSLSGLLGAISTGINKSVCLVCEGFFPDTFITEAPSRAWGDSSTKLGQGDGVHGVKGKEGRGLN